MKKKKLTINKLALGNLKQRRKQYTILIIGIILAMVFSSSTLFFMYSSNETYHAEQFDRFGKQHAIYSVYDDDDGSIYPELLEKGLITDYSFAHIIGYGYTDSDNRSLGFPIGWLDDKAKNISNQSFIEGSYPQNDGEIALEQTALIKLGMDAQIGDEITFTVDIQDGINYYGTTEKTYKLVGIVTDKRKNLYEDSIVIPAAFVARETQTEIGGKELLTAYLTLPLTNERYSVWRAEGDVYQYLYSIYDGDSGYFARHSNEAYFSDDFFGGITGSGGYIAVIAVVLIFVSCLAIVNAFNTNLKERKKQIGMLRAVGATKRQIIKIFGREALIISLISTPISVAISYGIVWLGISLMNEKAVMTSSFSVLAISAVVCVIITMLSAMIPLLSASRITPMQVIRNIEITRKMNTKKIKSKKVFDVPSHLAKRNAKLYKGGKIAVSAILVATIIFSCLGFSYFNYAKENASFSGWDYTLTWMSYYYNGDFANYKHDLSGMSEADEREIEAYPYFGEVVSEKQINSIFEIEEITDYFRCFQYMREALEGGVGGYYLENRTADEMEKYVNLFSRGKNIVNAPLYSFDQNMINSLDDCLTAGKIDIDKLASGEEIILVAPLSAKYSNHVNEHGSLGEVFYDGEAVPEDCEIIYEGECPFSIGDKINISVFEYTKDAVEDELSSNDFIRTDREVTVGAIVNPEKFWNKFRIYNDEFGFIDFSFLTVHSGMNAFCKTAKYGELYINTDPDIKLDDETDATITEFMTAFDNKYGGYFQSEYTVIKEAEDKLNFLLVEIISIVLIGFVICAAIINNSLTASIREKKKEIGTLRAVGADISVLVKSYIRQLLSMLGIGYGAGFAAFGIIYALMAIISNIKKEEFEFIFSPLETLAFCLILFVICSVNLWSKVRKEMKNSIVDNIREL
ncbi:MAG: FtsX-like permease family protein [Eubacterium sp.]|nr:FtsX-like permease family protein [Eubacterium sp.]